MSEIKRNFLQGKMNMDVDERLVPEGQVVYSLNNLIVNSEGSDVGAIENSLGNRKITSLNLTNAKTIGKFEDHAAQILYYFVTSDEKDLLLEYYDVTETVSVILESNRIAGKTLLGFRKDKLITGVVKIINGSGEGDLFGWTDDNEQPRLINLDRAKTYGADGFTEDDISLIKKPPLFAPEIDLTFAEENTESGIKDKFISFCYAFKYEDGQVSALSPFSNAAFSAKKFELDPNTMENNGMQNAFTAVNVRFDTGDTQVTDVILAFKEANSNTVYIVDSFNKEENNWLHNSEQTFKFSNIKIYAVMQENELYRLYDAVPRRAKAMDVVGNRIALANYLEGYNLIDSLGRELKIDFTLELNAKNLSGAATTKTLSTVTTLNDVVAFNLTGIELKKGGRLSFDFQLREIVNETGIFRKDFDFILNKDYASAVELAGDPEFILFIETFVTNSFLDNYTLTPPENSQLNTHTGFSIISSTVTEISIKSPSISYEVDNTPADTTDMDYTTVVYNWKFEEETALVYKTVATDSSCKSNRSYEVAQIYLDEYGRSSTALPSSKNTLFIPQANSSTQNKIRVNVNHSAPAWAKYYRFAIKQDKGGYHTIFANVFYEDKLFRWVKLDGANKDKVKEGDTLIVKSDLGGALSDVIKVRVLEVAQKPENFLEGNEISTGVEIKEEAGLYMKIKPNGFDMNFTDGTTRTFEGNSHLRYPSNTYTNPIFGTTDANGAFVPYRLPAGASVRIFISFSAKGSISYQAVYDERIYVNSDYDSIQQWFNTEVGDLGSFGENYTRGWGFTENGDRFYARAHRDGTASRSISTTVRFEVFFTEGFVIFETEPEDHLSEIYNELGQTYPVNEGGLHSGNIQDQTDTTPAIIELDFFNCFTLGRGIESYRYKDAINKKFLSIDTRPTLDSSKEFKEIHRYADITYSEPFVESLGINGLSTFNLANANYKDDIIKKYGSIQRIIARDSDLLVMQEDKISKVLYGKELVMSPDGSSNLTGINQVLGSQVFYAGEFGISKNPESVALSGTRIYFTDEKRNQVCRLSIDGITPISTYGLTSYFRNLFKDTTNKEKLGAFDPYIGNYVLAADGATEPAVVFNDSVNGWTSFFSYKPEMPSGLNGKFFSFSAGELYKHNDKTVPRNNFYGQQFTSKVAVVLNDQPSVEKMFKNIMTESNNKWGVKLTTNLTKGEIFKNEFEKKKSRFFAYTRRNEDATDLTSFSVNGIGISTDVVANTVFFRDISEMVNVGDLLYQIQTEVQIPIGIIQHIDRATGEVNFLAYQNQPLVGKYCYATKNPRVEGGEIRGYFLRVDMENDATDFSELFAVTSNTAESYV